MRRPLMMLLWIALAAGCADRSDADDQHSADAKGGADGTGEATCTLPPLPTSTTGASITGDLPGAKIRFDLTANTTSEADDLPFFALPWPSDLRRAAGPGGTLGGPDVRGIPNPKALEMLDGLIEAAAELSGHSVMSVGWFDFDAPLAPRTEADGPWPLPTLPPNPPDSSPADGADGHDAGGTEPPPPPPVQLIDVTHCSPHFGERVPVVGRTLQEDDYTPQDTLALSARPGFVLRANATYAFVVLRTLGDADGELLGTPRHLRELLHGQLPSIGDEAMASAARTAYLSLALALPSLGLAPDQIAAATVFTTGDAMADNRRVAEQLRARYSAAEPTEQSPAALAPVTLADGSHGRFCQLSTSWQAPIFQEGKAPYNDDGLFVLDSAGRPVEQARETVPVTITLPNREMPADGWPLVLYVHGSGGLSTQVVDRGPVLEEGGPGTRGEGPAYVLAAHGLAAVGMALPINPQRFESATDVDYINLNNLKVYRDNIRQGVFEQAMLLDLLGRLQIDPQGAGTTAAGACAGLALPEGASAHRFDMSRVMLMGQSQGSIHTNLLGAIDPRIRAIAPTGGGGFSSHYILITERLPARGVIGALLGTTVDLTWMHPVMQVLQVAWEPAESIVAMPRHWRRPLDGVPAKHVYQPVGLNDSFYPPQLFDALALAFGHPQAGAIIWPSMQQALALDDRAGVEAYPVRGNVVGERDDIVTSAVVQYEDDGISDGHHIFVQLPAVRRQYSCLFKSVALGHEPPTLVSGDGAPEDCGF